MARTGGRPACKLLHLPVRTWLDMPEPCSRELAKLRGRDAVHEALRLGAGRSAMLDALYHFDVILTSSVASLDALARVAHDVFGLSSPVERIGWQRPWRNELGQIVPGVAGVVAPNTRLGAALLILTRMRNSIHSIP